MQVIIYASSIIKINEKNNNSRIKSQQKQQNIYYNEIKFHIKIFVN